MYSTDRNEESTYTVAVSVTVTTTCFAPLTLIVLVTTCVTSGVSVLVTSLASPISTAKKDTHLTTTVTGTVAVVSSVLVTSVWGCCR
jgi:hypothetical protein